MATIRTHKTKENPYVMIDKRPLEDTRLSWEAKGLHAYLMSKPDSWTVNVKHLIKQSRNGRDATYRIVNELIYAGYIERVQERSEEGKLGELIYIVYELPTHLDPFELPKKRKTPKELEAEESPHTESQDTVSDPHTEKPYTANTYISNKEVSNNDLKIKRDDDNTLARESINSLIFEKYKEQITYEQFAVILERIPQDKETVNYKSYLVTCVEAEIRELNRKASQSTLKQQAAAGAARSQTKKGRSSTRTHKQPIEIVPYDPEAGTVSPEEFEAMMQKARDIKAAKSKKMTA